MEETKTGAAVDKTLKPHTSTMNNLQLSNNTVFMRINKVVKKNSHLITLLFIDKQQQLPIFHLKWH